MRIWVNRFLFLALLVVLNAQRAAADSIVIGAPGDAAFCIPFGCNVPDRYQQIYSGATFGQGFLITEIGFPYTLDQMSPFIDPANYIIRLATTATAVGSLSTNLDSNVGADAVVVFSGPLSGAVERGSALSLTLPVPFLFDPSNGNLLLDVTKSGGVFFGDDGIYLDFNTSMAGRSSSVFRDLAGTGVIFTAGGLVTSFSGQDVAAPTPEPGTLMLLMSGLVGGYLARRRAKP